MVAVSADMGSVPDSKIQYWFDFHNHRITAERHRIGNLRADTERYSESYLGDLIESCETTIRHSERALGDLNAEVERRQAQ